MGRYYRPKERLSTVSRERGMTRRVSDKVCPVSDEACPVDDLCDEDSFQV